MKTTERIRNELEILRDCFFETENISASILKDFDKGKIISSSRISAFGRQLKSIREIQKNLDIEYEILFEKHLESEPKISELEADIFGYETECINEKTGKIYEKFITIKADSEECTLELEKYAEMLKNKEFDREQIMSVADDYEKFYEAVKSDDITEKINFSSLPGVFSSDDLILLNLIQGKFNISEEVKELKEPENKTDENICSSDSAEDDTEDMLFTELSFFNE